MPRKSKDGQKNGDYETGYGKPPKKYQFQKGVSGNSKGRPKGSRNFKTDFMEELQTTMEIKEGNKKYTITKQRALVKSMINGAIKGDPRTTDMVAKLTLSLDSSEEAGQGTSLTAEERDILLSYLQEEKNNVKKQ